MRIDQNSLYDFILFYNACPWIFYLTHIPVLDSISTATAGPSVVGLITFAALSWGTTLPTPVMTWFFAHYG